MEELHEKQGTHGRNIYAKGTILCLEGSIDKEALPRRRLRTISLRGERETAEAVSAAEAYFTLRIHTKYALRRGMHSLTCELYVCFFCLGSGDMHVWCRLQRRLEA